MLQNLKINDIPKSQRPREKLLTYGSESLLDEELLAIVLRTGSKNEDVIQLATSIIRNLGGLQGLFKSSPKELMKIHGVKEAKATQILALCELYRRYRTTCIYQEKISKPSDIVEVIIDDIGHLMQEVFVLVTLDTKNKIISKKKLFVGSLNSSLVHPREIFKEALKDSAASIIVCHNHPSGDPTPSKEDIDITLRVKECGKIMGIELLDHIILGKNKFLSLKEKAIL